MFHAFFVCSKPQSLCDCFALSQSCLLLFCYCCVLVLRYGCCLLGWNFGDFVDIQQTISGSSAAKKPNDKSRDIFNRLFFAAPNHMIEPVVVI